MTVDDERRRLTRAWTQQLYREHADIQYRYRLKLRKPVIRLDDVSSRWGHWDPATRTITLSRALIERYPWDVAVEVLKHEVAHQLVDELLGGDERPHGPRFQHACGVLGVRSWAARATGALPDRALPDRVPRARHRGLNADQARLLKKVEKLLALATSANEHEASLAMKRVQELYARHNLEAVRRDARPEVVYTVLTRRRKRMPATEAAIFAILVEHFFVQVIHTRQYDAADDTVYRAAEVIGTPENVAMAEYVYEFLWRTIHTLWDDFKRRTGTSARGKRSYQLGVLHGFGDKLTRERTVVRVAAEVGIDERGCRALVRQADRRLRELIRERHPRLEWRSWGGGHHDAGSFDAGVADGAQVTLRKGVGGGRQNRGRLLTS